MSHRDLSITGHITNETHGIPAKDRDCIRRTGFPCTRIPESLYERAEAMGVDMSNFVIIEPMPRA